MCKNIPGVKCKAPFQFFIAIDSVKIRIISIGKYKPCVKSVCAEFILT